MALFRCSSGGGSGSSLPSGLVILDHLRNTNYSDAVVVANVSNIDSISVLATNASTMYGVDDNGVQTSLGNASANTATIFDVSGYNRLAWKCATSSSQLTLTTA